MVLLKYLDLHNKILRDAEDPDEVADSLLKNGYYVVGVNAHNAGDEVKNKEHYYKFFESHFSLFEKKGLLMLPAVEIKIRDGNYDALQDLIAIFAKKFIPVHHKGAVHHVPFMIFVHGGHGEANRLACRDENTDILCHPEKDECIFTAENAKDAAANDVGIEVNYREYTHSENKKDHEKKVRSIIDRVKLADGKLVLFSAAIHESELAHIKELVAYGRQLHEDLVAESIENVHTLVQAKYGKLLAQTGYSLETMKKRHDI